MRSDLSIVAERAAETVGARIKRRRRELEKTQKELAAEAGINQGYLSLIERDKAKPRRPTFDALAVALDWPRGCSLARRPPTTRRSRTKRASFPC